MRIVAAHTVEYIGIITQLFREYQQAVDAPVCFQTFELELAGLPGQYAPPAGALLLALEGNAPAGCVAVRAIADNVAEMKRLFVRTDYRGTGLGRALTTAAITEACRMGYRKMRLDTLDSMVEARRLYADLGFVEIGPYHENSFSGMHYMELALSA